MAVYMPQKPGILILLLLSLCTLVSAQDLYDINNITTVELTFNESNWDYLLDQLYAAGDEERLMGTAVVNGIQFDSVGVRYKGNSSYSSQNAKNPLNIKLDYMIDDQEYDNYGTLKLSNVFKDPSFVREVLSYEIARNYMPASLSNYAKVSINGVYMGLYSSTQDVDKYFAKTHYGSKSNPFFKGELTNDNPNTVTTVWGYNGILPSSYASYFELESDEGWNDLINFLDVFNNDVESIEDVLNVDRHLWMLAFDNLMVNLDAPINFAHNFYLYQDNSGRFNPIIWDLNENFGVFSRLLTGYELNISSMQQMNPYLNATSSYYPIIKQVLSNERYKKIYIAHMKTIIKDYFTNGLFRARALELQEFIDTEVQNDQNKFYTYNNFLGNVDAAVSISGDRPGMVSSIVGLTQLMDARVAYLNSHSDFTPIAPSISNVISSPSNISIGDKFTLTCEITSGDTVKFCYRSSVNDVFTKINMYDDGAHADGASNDGKYGVTINANSSYLEYYIYSENGYAASFMPEGAEYDVYKLNISGKLVLNEFMADNKSTVADANNDYDDWIELYNNTENDISLSGYYLSDDESELTQWAFPDTIIPAYSYLIVWADNDEEVGELHANFKLSASGEAIYLTNPSSVVIDEIVFGAQSEDVSMGRYENGIGSWTYMSPTFSIENIADLSNVDDGNAMTPSEFLLEPNYPNPFNPTTTISFSLPEAGDISLFIYNAAGKLVDVILDGQNCAVGYYSYQWNASQFASGLYIAVLHNGVQRSTQKLMLLK
jgi:spore coat protein CotH